MVQPNQTPCSQNTSCIFLHRVLVQDLFYSWAWNILPVISTCRKSTLPLWPNENASNIPKFFSAPFLFKIIAPFLCSHFPPCLFLWSLGERQQSIRVKSPIRRLWHAGFKPKLCHLLALCPLASYFISLSFVIWKMGIRTVSHGSITVIH